MRRVLRPARPVPLAPARRIGGWLALALGLPSLTAALVDSDADSLAVGLLLYLGIVLAAGAIGGLGPGLVGAFAAAASANYFVIPPVHELTIGKTTDLVALVMFLAVAVTVSTLVHRSARLAADAARARSEAGALAGSTATLLGEIDPLPALLRRLVDVLSFDAAAVYTPTGSGWALAASSGAHPPAPDEASVTRLGAANGAVLAVREREPLTSADRDLLRSLADHLALALDARELQADAARAAALEQGDALRTSILRAVSHDLRTPLASIKASVSSLLGHEVQWDAETVEHFHRTIDTEADRLDRLVGNLLDMSRLQAGALNLRLEPIVLDDVVSSALASLSPDANAVKVEIPDDAPFARGDAALVERALANLLSNALTHAPEGTEVRVVAEPDGDDVALRVVDHGPGVTPTEMGRLVEPFQRLDDASTRPGVGLGLAVAHGFVAAMGGRLSFDTTPGGGLTASILLPAAGDHRDA